MYQGFGTGTKNGEVVSTVLQHTTSGTKEIE